MKVLFKRFLGFDSLISYNKKLKKFSGFSRVRLLKVDVPLEVPEDSKTLEVRHQVLSR